MFLAYCDTLKKNIYIQDFVTTTFCQFSKLNKDKLPFNYIDKNVTKGSSVPFETCMLHLMYPRYLCGHSFL